MRAIDLALMVLPKIKVSRGKKALFVNGDGLKVMPLHLCKDWSNNIGNDNCVGVYDKNVSIKDLEEDIKYKRGEV
jgi:hypothetical protein